MSSMMACDMGIKKAPVTPWPTRKRTSEVSESAAPQNTENTVNPPIDARNSRLRPNLELSQPVVGIMMAPVAM